MSGGLKSAAGAGRDAWRNMTSFDTGNPLSRGNFFKAFKVMNLATSGVVGQKANQVLPGFNPPPAAPQQEAPLVMPLPDSASVEAAKKKQMNMISAGGGRASTILSQNDRLGG